MAQSALLRRTWLVVRDKTIKARAPSRGYASIPRMAALDADARAASTTRSNDRSIASLCAAARAAVRRSTILVVRRRQLSVGMQSPSSRRLKYHRHKSAVHGSIGAQALRGRETPQRARLAPAPLVRHWQGLIRHSLSFLASPWWLLACRHGWALVEVFGINGDAALVRVDGWGLAIAPALSSLPPTRLVELTCEGAAFATQSGAALAGRASVATCQSRRSPGGRWRTSNARLSRGSD